MQRLPTNPSNPYTWKFFGLEHQRSLSYWIAWYDGKQSNRNTLENNAPKNCGRVCEDWTFPSSTLVVGFSWCGVVRVMTERGEPWRRRDSHAEVEQIHAGSTGHWMKLSELYNLLRTFPQLIIGRKIVKISIYRHHNIFGIFFSVTKNKRLTRNIYHVWGIQDSASFLRTISTWFINVCKKKKKKNLLHTYFSKIISLLK